MSSSEKDREELEKLIQSGDRLVERNYGIIEFQGDTWNYCLENIMAVHRQNEGGRWIQVWTRREAIIEERERRAFEAGKATVETCQQEGGYSFNHHRHDKYRTFDDYKDKQ